MLRSDNDIPSDVYAVETTKSPGVRTSSQQVPVALDKHQRLRKATPAETPLRRTLDWAESLPPRVRPKSLLRQYARVANLIAATWADLESFETYMESLLIDKRGSRKGFPPDVMAELHALELYRLAIQGNEPWVDVSKRG